MSPMKCLVILGVLFCGIQADTYTHQDALSRLKAAGISVSSSGGCSNRNDASCTSLEGIHSEAIRDLITLKEVTGCPIVVTGGTETGHGISRNPNTRSHWNGWKLDIRKRGNDCTTRYIENTFNEIKPKFWQAASGNIYYDEGNHWDIQYGNPRRNRRSLTEDCLNCICNVESGCRPLPCKWDVNSNSCGYFQIKLDYYRDCYMPGKRAGESEVTAWKRCAADYDCSVQCIEAYVRRYGGRCQASSQCEKIARLHNGGPSGCSKRATLGYWNKVWNCL